MSNSTFSTSFLETWTSATVDLVSIAAEAHQAALFPSLMHGASGNGAAGEAQPHPDRNDILSQWEVTVSERDVRRLGVCDHVEFSGHITEADIRCVTGGSSTYRSDGDADGDGNRGRSIAGGHSPAGDVYASYIISAALEHLPGVVTYLSQNRSFLNPISTPSHVSGLIEIVEDIGSDQFRVRTTLETPEATVTDGEAFLIIRDPDRTSARDSS